MRRRSLRQRGCARAAAAMVALTCLVAVAAPAQAANVNSVAQRIGTQGALVPYGNAPVSCIRVSDASACGAPITADSLGNWTYSVTGNDTYTFTIGTGTDQYVMTTYVAASSGPGAWLLFGPLTFGTSSATPTFVNGAASNSGLGAMEMRVPFAGTAKGTACQANNRPASGKSYTGTLVKNNSGTVLTCTVDNASPCANASGADRQCACSDTAQAHWVTFVALDRMTYQFTHAGAPADTTFTCTVWFEAAGQV